MRNGLLVVLVMAIAMGLGYAAWLHDAKNNTSSGALPVHYDMPLSLQTSKGDIALKVQIARTDIEEQTGMMFRTSVAADEGMLFLFTGADMRYFWMKNTLIPLDIIYIGAKNEIVSIHRMAAPHDLTPLSSEVPASAVLEVKGGQADLWGLKIGDTIASEAIK